jgi:hypothetical protein
VRDQETEQYQGTIGWGLGITIVLNMVQGIVLWLILSNATGDASFKALFIGLGGWGVLQLVYVVPLYLYMRKKETDTAKGIIIAASLVILVNATCWGLLGFSR